MYTTGQAGLYQCLDGTNISISAVCDQHADCNDSSDEDWCAPVEGYEVIKHFTQANGKSCMCCSD